MSQSASIDEKAYTAELNREAGIPLYRQLEKRFCAMLQEGTLTHGEQLPSEAELMEQYGVSRTTVRLALKELEGKGSAAAVPTSPAQRSSIQQPW